MPEKQITDAAEVSAAPETPKFSDFYDLTEEQVNATVDEPTEETAEPAEEPVEEEEPIESPEEDSGEEAEESEESESVTVTAKDAEIINWVKQNAAEIHKVLKREDDLSKPGFESLIKEVIEKAAETHKTTPEAILTKLGYSAPEENSTEEEGEELEPWEKDYITRAKKAASKEFAPQIQSLQEELQRLKEAEQKRIEEAELKTKVEQSYAGLANRIEKETGFKPTKAQAEKAIAKHPNLEPADAIKLVHMNDIVKAANRNAAKSAPKAPTIPAFSSDTGRVSKDRKSFSDFFADIEAES